MKEFEGKKLLILGGNPETIPLVEIANNMGIKTIVSSKRVSDPAKKHAWKAYDVDGMDVPGLIALAQEEKVDGVLVGVADILVPAYSISLATPLRELSTCFLLKTVLKPLVSVTAYTVFPSIILTQI